MEKDDIKKYSLEEIEDFIVKGDYSPTRKSTDEFSIDPEFWENVEIVHPKAKRSVHLRIDEEILDWFKAQGPGHLTRMQTVIKSFYQAHSH